MPLLTLSFQISHAAVIFDEDNHWNFLLINGDRRCHCHAHHHKHTLFFVYFYTVVYRRYLHYVAIIIAAKFHATDIYYTEEKMWWDYLY